MQPRTALITGVLGQDGSYLSCLSLDKGYRVIGLFIANGVLFSHESPLPQLGFVTRKISHVVAAITLGKRLSADSAQRAASGADAQ